MALRRVEILAPVEAHEHLVRLVQAAEPLEIWSQSDAKASEIRALFLKQDVEKVLDTLSAYMELQPGVQVAVLEVRAALPQQDDEGQAPKKPKKDGESPAPQRISRDELYAEISKGAGLSSIYVVTVILSTIVAAIGLLRGSPAIVIGAMVIAPLMGPNMALALATALGDGTLARRALITNAVGICCAVLVAAAIGVFLDPIHLSDPEIAARIHPHWTDVALALASGTAGALAYTSGVSSSLVGVMVAVALLPPTVVATLLAVQGHSEASRAALLLATNIVGVNLAGVATFVVQGIRPRTWWEAKRSKRASVWALSFMLALLVLFTILVVFAQSTG